MFNFFKKRNTFDVAKQMQFAEAMSVMLHIQFLCGSRSPEEVAEYLAIPANATTCQDWTYLVERRGSIDKGVLGYVYGYVDAALQIIGQDMGDESVGVPITGEVLRRLFPGRYTAYLEYLVTNVHQQDAALLEAMKIGGQNYIDCHNKKIAQPMGLSKYLIVGDWVR